MIFARNLKTSPHLSLLADCDDGCTEVYGRYMERQTKTQDLLHFHLSVLLGL